MWLTSGIQHRTLPTVNLPRTPIWTWLERVANLGIFLVSLVILSRVLGPGPAPSPSLGIVSVGDRIEIGDLPTGYRVLVVFRPDCKFCLESMPFYGELLGIDGGSKRLAFVTPHGQELATRQALPLGSSAALVLGANFRKNRFVATPMILRIDKEQRVRAIWRGTLGGSEEGRVRQLLREGDPGG